MNVKNEKRIGTKENLVNQYFSSIKEYIKEKYPYLIIAIVGFLAVSALNFMKVSTAETVASFVLNDYEVGQISDRTIIADKTLSPTADNPVSIQKGEKIIKKGFAITQEAYEKLEKMSKSPIYIDYRAFANGELYLFMLALTWYLLFAFLPVSKKNSIKECILHVFFFLMVYATTAFGGKLAYFSSAYSICIIIPASLCIMLVTILYGNISSVLLSFLISFGVLNAGGWQISTFIYILATCLSSAAVVRKITRRIDLVLASIVLALFNVAYMIFVMVLFNENFVGFGKISLGIIINGFLSGILTLGFLTPLEVILNTSSVFRLMDLSDLNAPIFNQMKIQANGTYNHSTMVAQLAESACQEIGANALLARIGAYYHDIGKIDQSEYFVENQANGENKLIELNPTLSASVIKSHVKKGVEKAYQMHLPQAVIDIIAQHHGNSIIQYFYNEGTKKDPTLTPEDFSYPGVPPSTKEAAVVMLADAVEAACKTLDNPTAPRLEKFISVLIAGKVEHKQLDNCDLTFRDLDRIKASFVHMLTGYYHNRIKYQNQVEPDDNKDAKAEASTETKTEAKSEVKSEVKSEERTEAKPVREVKSAVNPSAQKTVKPASVEVKNGK